MKRNGKRVFKKHIKNISCTFFGDNNYVEIHEPFNISNFRCTMVGSDSKIVIGKNFTCRKFNVRTYSESSVIVGDNAHFVDVKIYATGAKKQCVEIGKNSLMSFNVYIKTSDGHTLYDEKTMNVLNKSSGKIIIGDHVWICPNVSILKDARIADNCVVGSMSLINKQFDEKGSLIAGIPAKVIKNGINWDKTAVENFEQKYV